MRNMPRCPRDRQLCAVEGARRQTLSGLSWPRITEWSSRRNARRAHTSQKRQLGEFVRCLSHAEGRERGCAGIVRAVSYFQVHHANDERQVQNAEPVYLLPYRQDNGLGGCRVGEVAECVAVASGQLR